MAASGPASFPGPRCSAECRYDPGCGLAHSTAWGRDGAGPTSNLQLHDNRHMIRRLLPAAHLLQDGLGFERALEAGAEPDMIEPAASVRGLPILGAVAPPGIDFLV